MRKILLSFMALCFAFNIMAQGMSDDKVLEEIASGVKAGKSESQIVSSLVQKGVNIQQIRRLRNQYDKQISSRGLSSAADGAVRMAAERMQGNTDGTSSQELTTARKGTTGEVYIDANENVSEIEREVKATQGTAPEANGKKSFRT